MHMQTEPECARPWFGLQPFRQYLDPRVYTGASSSATCSLCSAGTYSSSPGMYHVPRSQLMKPVSWAWGEAWPWLRFIYSLLYETGLKHCILSRNDWFKLHLIWFLICICIQSHFRWIIATWCRLDTSHTLKHITLEEMELFCLYNNHMPRSQLMKQVKCSLAWG